MKQLLFIPAKKDLCSQTFTTLKLIPDLFRTMFGTLVRIRTKSGIPDLSGPAACQCPPSVWYIVPGGGRLTPGVCRRENLI